MAATLGTFCFSVAILFSGAQSSSEYEFANILITNEDGQEQIFTVKQMKSHAKTCTKNVCHSGSDDGLGADDFLEKDGESQMWTRRYPITSTMSTVPPSSRPLALAPTITINIGNILSDCDSAEAGSHKGMCLDFQRLVSASTDTSTFLENKESMQDYAYFLADNGLLPVSSGDIAQDRIVAYGLVMLSTGVVDETIVYFDKILKTHPKCAGGYHARGLAYTRKTPLKLYVDEALNNFNKAQKLSPNSADPYERKAELLIPLRLYEDAMQNIDKAMSIKPTNRALFLRATVKLACEDLYGAERDYREVLKQDQYSLHALQNLGLTLYYRGKLRNAVEVFRDALRLKDDYVDAHISLGHIYSELGDYSKALSAFNKSLVLAPGHSRALQLKGSMYYQRGQTNRALAHFTQCLEQDPQSDACRYMHGVSHTALGHFYEGVKSFTKVVVRGQRVMRATPEFIKANYLKEYARYLHHHLDSPVADLNLEKDFSSEFRDHWAKLESFRFTSPYREQPGITPDVTDISSPTDLTPLAHTLVCTAQRVGKLAQLSVDGIMASSRQQVAVGLAVIHIAQHSQKLWKEIKTKSTTLQQGWRDMCNLAIQYIRLVDPDIPILWFDHMPQEALANGYNKDLHFIKGHSFNIKLKQYFSLVYNLVKTMIQHSPGDDGVDDPELRQDIQKCETFEDLIALGEAHTLAEPGFVLSTQVPSMKQKTGMPHEGMVITLSGHQQGKGVLFSLNIPTLPQRLASYTAELDFIFQQLTQDIALSPGRDLLGSETMVNQILSLVYYLYNLTPLTHHSSLVAYSVALGLLMSVGKEVTGYIPPGKLPEMEAMLAGAPEAFVMVAKNWMKIKRVERPVSELPCLTTVLPSVRSVLEALQMAPLVC